MANSRTSWIFGIVCAILFAGLANAQRELKTIVLTPEQVEHYNTMQVMCSAKYVFCQENDFA